MPLSCGLGHIRTSTLEGVHIGEDLIYTPPPLFIYLLGNCLNPATTVSLHINAMERDKKERKGKGPRPRGPNLLPQTGQLMRS